MPDQIILAWAVDAAGTSLGAAGAATKLAAVPLYTNIHTDPVLGQLFGLTVATDQTTTFGNVATRTLTLNMSPTAFAPFPFPCHPRTSSPPVLPYPLRRTVTLPGSFFPTTGLFGVATSATQLPSINPGDTIQFLSQPGVSYTVASVLSSTQIVLSSAYTGTMGNTGAFKEVVAPVTKAAIYSTSPLDTAAVATSPAISAGPGAHTVILTYHDSTGGGPFNVAALLTGKRPVQLILAVGSVDIAQIDGMQILAAGSFGSSVGQITLVELSEDLPSITLASKTPDNFRGPLTDQAQLLIAQHLAYLPPSYFSIAQQSNSKPQLAGDFIVTTGSTNVPTTVDQTGVLSPGSIIQFAEQLQNNTAFGVVEVTYVVDSVTPSLVKLTAPFTGIDNNNTGTNNVGTNSDAGSKGNIGSVVNKKATAAFLILSAVPPTNDQLSAALGQFVAPETAGPPPNAPLPPGTVPAPTFLSGLFTRTLSLALAMPVSAQPITFL